MPNSSEKNVFLPVFLQQLCRIEGLTLPINLPFYRKSNPIYSVFPIRLCFLDLLSFSEFPRLSSVSDKIFAGACCLQLRTPQCGVKQKVCFPCREDCNPIYTSRDDACHCYRKCHCRSVFSLKSVASIHPSLQHWPAAPHPLLVLLFALPKFRPLQLTWIMQHLIFFVAHHFWFVKIVLEAGAVI